MALDALPPTRRIVTAIDDAGRSYLAEDGTGPGVFELPGSPYRNHNLWRTGAAPADIGAADSIGAHKGVLPPAGGSVLRVIDFPPMLADRAEQAKLTAQVFAALYPDADHHAGSERSASMHTTDTVDYAIVLAGEMWAVMDVGETLMKAGDVLIQRGTAHGWENRSDAMARVAFVLIDGVRGVGSLKGRNKTIILRQCGKILHATSQHRGHECVPLQFIDSESMISKQ